MATKRKNKKSSPTSALKKTPPESAEEDSFAPAEAWNRFERAVDVAVATKPIHKPTTKGRKG